MSRQSHQRGRKVESSNVSTFAGFYWFIGLVLIVGMVLIFTYTTGKGASVTSTTASSTVSSLPSPIPITPNADLPPLSSYTSIPSGTTPEGFYYKGNPNAPVTVVEYADFECPACAYHDQTMIPKLGKDFIETGKARLVFHDFPLTQHTVAPLASATTRCAGEQGKFWEAHDAIFAQRETWIQNPSISTFVSIVGNSGADPAKLETCLKSGKYDQQIAAAREQSIQAGIDSTPSFIVNGKKVEINQLFSEIEALLATKGQ